MKNHSRILAAALAAVMALGTAALAVGDYKTIDVFTGMTLKVNDQVVTPTKSDGTPAEVFAYEGATYVPARFVSENLGVKVDYDAATQTASISGGLTYSDTIAWDGEYDVVVVGLGLAGAAAKTAADAGAKVLVTEKAPEGHEGGNSRVCGQAFVYGYGNEEAVAEYYTALTAGRRIPDALFNTWVKGVANSIDILAQEFGFDPDEVIDMKKDPAMSKWGYTPEYPGFPGGDSITLCVAHDGVQDGYLWRTIRNMAAEKCDVWFESPATKLIQDPVTKAILGVTIDHEGESTNIKAKNGVVMACGGFENNPDMIETYLGLVDSRPYGTIYNTGDGIRMVQEVGADLWHMDAYEGPSSFGLTPIVPENTVGTRLKGSCFFSGSLVIVGADGNRFVKEDDKERHGHHYHTGTWQNPQYSTRNFLVYDQAQADIIAASGAYPAGYEDLIIKADTLKELAEKTGMDPDILTNTIKRFNGFAKKGVDEQFGRAAEAMTPLSDKGPYYAIEAIPSILNTQGGPRHNEKAEVLNHDGDPIPHLYAAGEFGSICAYQYQGGGDMAECFIFGNIAGKNAAAPKTDVVSAPLVTAADNIRFTLGSAGTDKKGPDITTGANEYVGVSHNAMGGDLYVKVTMENGKIAKVEVLEQNETVGIGDKAVAALPEAIVKANSTDVDNISGATITSKAIKEAVSDALSQAQ